MAVESGIPVYAELDGVRVEDSNIQWSISNNISTNTKIENGRLYLGLDESNQSITINAIITYDETNTLEYSTNVAIDHDLQVHVFNGDNPSSSIVINNGDTEIDTLINSGYTVQVRVCDKNRIPVDGADLTFWVGEVDITGGGENCTNGFIEAGTESDSIRDGQDYWWFWAPATGDESLRVTFKASYGVSQFVATAY